MSFIDDMNKKYLPQENMGVATIVPTSSAMELSRIEEEIQERAKYEAKKDMALFETADASKKNVKLLEEQVEMLKGQNSSLEEEVKILKETNERQKEQVKLQEEQIKVSKKSSKSATILALIAIGFAVISIGVSFLLHFIGKN